MAYTPGINGGRINFSLSANSAITNGSGTAGALSLISTGSIYLAGGSNITLSQSQNSITINGTAPTLSRWEYPQQEFMPIGVPVQGSLSLQHMYIPFNVSGSSVSMKVGGMLSVSSVSNGSFRTGSISLSMAVYTLTGSTLSSVSSGSALNTFGFYAGTSTSGVSQNSSVTGMRQLTVPMNTLNMTPGEYWIGAAISSSNATATANQSFTMTLYGNTDAGNAGNNILTPLGAATSAGRDVMLFQGMYATTTNSIPATIQGSQINNTGVSFVQSANFYHAIYNATY